MYQTIYKYLLKDKAEISNTFSELLQKKGINYAEYTAIDEEYGMGAFNAIYVPPTRPGKLLLVSHIDTVWDGMPVIGEPVTVNNEFIVNREVLRKTTREIFSNDKLVGIGADDRLGVATIHHIVENDLLNGHGILLSDGEEIALGSYAIATNPEIRRRLLDDKYNWMLEFDYPGVDSFTTYRNEDKKFVEAIESLTGFTRQPGSFSDIRALGDYTGYYGINVAIGYVRQHTPRETIILSYWERNWKEFIEPMITEYYKKVVIKYGE